MAREPSVHQNRSGRRRSILERVRVYGEVHVMAELGLVGPAATDAHAAAFTAGHRCSIRQRHRRMTAVPADHQSARGGSVLKPRANNADSSFPVLNLLAESRPVGRHVRYQRSQTRTVDPRGRISAGDIRRARHLLKQSHQRC